MNKSYEMAKRLLVDSIWKSANLEGLGTTYPKTELIINNIPTNTSREEVLFIVNMKRAWEFLLKDTYEYPLNISLLREYNRICGDKLFYRCGEIRTMNVTIGGTSWVPDIPIYGVVRESLEDIKSIKDDEIKALKLFCYIARSQIFIDGNKRVAQLASNKVLIEADKGIFQIPVESIETFKSLLLQFYETNDDKNIINFMQGSCIVRPNQVKPVKNKSSDKYSFSVRRESFNLSDKQLVIISKVLNNIIKFLSSIEEGYYTLEEENNVVSLTGVSLFIRMNLQTLECIESNVNKILTDDAIYCIINTIKLLNKHIPMDIHKIVFPVNINGFESGTIQRSKQKGCVDIYIG